jgi:hypothetical protein
MKEINLDILKDGTIRFVRGDKISNEYLLKILSEINPSAENEVKNFLDAALQIKVLIGKNTLCG